MLINIFCCSYLDDQNLQINNNIGTQRNVETGKKQEMCFLCILWLIYTSQWNVNKSILLIHVYLNFPCL